MNQDEKNMLLKKVRENFKKKRKRWLINYNNNVTSMNEAYDESMNVMNFLSNSFNEDEKEKFSFNSLKVSVSIPKKDEHLYKINVTFG